MALERIVAPQTTIQPAGGTTAATDVQAAQTANSVTMQGIAQVGQLGEQVTQFSTQIMRDETLKQAQKDAAQVVKRDADGNLLPYDEKSRGFGGILYNDTYNKASIEYYRSSALSEAQAKATEIVTLNPSNPAEVRKLLGEYLTAKIGQMPPDIAATMQIHYDGVLTGAVSSATAGQARGSLAAIDRQSKMATDDFVVQWGKAIADPRYQSGDPDVKQATDQKFDDQWKMVEGMLRQTGLTDAQINQQRKEAESLAMAHAEGTLLMQAAAAIGPLDTDAPKKLAALREEAIATAERNGNRLLTQPVLESYIARGQALAGAAREAQNLSAAKGHGEIAYEAAMLELRKQAGMGDQQYADEKAALLGRALGLSRGLSGAQRASYLAAAGSEIPTLLQSYGAAMTQAVGTITTARTPEERQKGYDEVKRIVSDPFVIQNATSTPQFAALIQTGQKAIAGQFQEAIAVDSAKWVAQAVSGQIGEKDMPAHFAEGQRMGIVGGSGLSAGEAWRHMAAGIAKNKEMLKANGEVAQLLNDNGGPPVFLGPDDAKKVEALRPSNFTVAQPGQAPKVVPFDMFNPEHNQKVLGDIFTKRYVNPQVLAAAAKINSHSTDDQKRWLVGMYEQVRGGLIDVNAAAGVSPDEQTAKTEATLATLFGGDTIRTIGAITRSAGDPAKMAALMASDNTGRQAPLADKDSATAQVTGIASDGLTNPNGMLTSGFIGGVKGIGRVFNSDGGWLDQTFTLFGNQGSRDLINSLPTAQDRGKFASLKPENVRLDPVVAAQANAFISGPGGHIETRGQANREQGLVPAKVGGYQFFEKNRSNLSVVYSEDPATGDTVATVKWRDFRAEFNRSQGTQWSDQRIKDLVSTTLRGTVPHLYDKINPDTVQFMTQVGAGGAPYWYATAKTKDGKDTMAFAIRPDDPNFSTVRADLGMAVAAEAKMPSISRFVTETMGMNFLREYIATNKEDSLLKLMSGRDMPTEEWAALVDTIAAPMASFMAKNPDFKGFSKEDLAKLRTKELQTTINRYGSLYTMLFGPQRMGNTIFGIDPAKVSVSDPVMKPGVMPDLEQERKDARDAMTPIEQIQFEQGAGKFTGPRGDNRGGKR